MKITKMDVVAVIAAFLVIVVGVWAFLTVTVIPTEPQTATLNVEPYALPTLQMGEKGSIYSLQVYQWNGYTWVYRGATSSSGGTITLVAEQPVWFDVVVGIDYYTVSPVSCTGAKGDTRVYLDIDGEVSATLMTAESCPSYIPDVVWLVLFTYDWDVAGKPAAGNTYTMTLTYQAYY